MKFKLSREDLLKPLQFISGVVEKRPTLPVLSHLLLQIRRDKLVLVGTDLEVELRANLNIESEEEADITLPARKFNDICRSLPEGSQLEISIQDGKAVLRSGKSRFTLATLPATEFPLTDDLAGSFQLQLAQGKLKDLLERTAFCMAIQDVRYYLNGLLLEMKQGQLRTVSTDGHRLALSELEFSELAAEDRQVIIPRKSVSELMRLLDDSETALCELVLSSNQVQIQMDSMVLTSKLIDARYPDYERVIPSSTEQHISANRSDLLHALQRTAILSNEKYRVIRLQFSNNLLRATVNNPEQETAEEEIIVDYVGSEFEIGFNVAYLLDVLGTIKEDQVVLNLTGSSSSCLLHGYENTASRYVVMPMRL